MKKLFFIVAVMGFISMSFTTKNAQIVSQKNTVNPVCEAPSMPASYVATSNYGAVIH